MSSLITKKLLFIPRKPDYLSMAATLLSGLFILLSGCADYQFTFNEQVIYEPPSLLSNFQVADSHLASCIAQTVEDQKVTAIEQLESLACSNAGIESLAGIEQFTELKQLNLDSNQISDIQPLSNLIKLELLYLAHNDLKNISPLTHLKKLHTLRLSGNDALECKPLLLIQDQIEQSLEAPEHCQL